jgi:AcrR family transcriptional regulator
MTTQLPTDGTSVHRSRRLTRGREKTILRVVYDMLADVGYQGVRYDRIATKARTSKVTLYRYWATKADLVVAAVAACAWSDCLVPDTGSLRGDLVAYFRLLAERLTGEEGAVLAGLLVAMRNDSHLAERLRPLLVPDPLPGWTIRTRTVERGEVREGCGAEAIDEISAPVLFVRANVRGLPTDSAYVEHLVDDIALPLLMAGGRAGDVG